MNGSLYAYIRARLGPPMCYNCVREDKAIKIGERYYPKKSKGGKTRYYHYDCWDRLLH